MLMKAVISESDVNTVLNSSASCLITLSSWLIARLSTRIMSYLDLITVGILDYQKATAVQLFHFTSLLAMVEKATR